MSADISLHVTSRGADRATLIGATGTGKSTLAAWLLQRFRDEYPDSRILVLDTKPRWRAEYLWDGTKAVRKYKRLAKGDTIPGSFSLDRPRDWQLVWDRDVNPSQTVIAQNIHATQSFAVRFQTWCAEKFFRSQDANRPSLIYFDEGMDFYTTSGSAKGGDIIQRCYRAGREMNLVPIFGSQRPVSINKQILSECNYLACFALDNRADVRRLWEYGWPHRELPPTMHDEDCPASCTLHDSEGVFRLWRKGHHAPKYRLRFNERENAA